MSQMEGTSSILCRCCWPSRHRSKNDDEKRPGEVTVIPLDFSVPSASNRPDIPTPPPSTFRTLTADFVTARTSRSADEQRYLPMSALINEIRIELLDEENLTEQTSQFVTFFRGPATSQPQLQSAPIPSERKTKKVAKRFPPLRRMFSRLPQHFHRWMTLIVWTIAFSVRAIVDRRSVPNHSPFPPFPLAPK